MATVLNWMPLKALLLGNIFQNPMVSSNQGIFITEQESQFWECIIAFNFASLILSVKEFICNSFVKFEKTLPNYCYFLLIVNEIITPMSDEFFVIGAQEKSIIPRRMEERVINQLHWKWLVKTLLMLGGWKRSSCDALCILGFHIIYIVHCGKVKLCLCQA